MPRKRDCVPLAERFRFFWIFPEEGTVVWTNSQRRTSYPLLPKPHHRRAYSGVRGASHLTSAHTPVHPPKPRAVLRNSRTRYVRARARSSPRASRAVAVARSAGFAPSGPDSFFSASSSASPRDARRKTRRRAGSILDAPRAERWERRRRPRRVVPSVAARRRGRVAARARVSGREPNSGKCAARRSRPAASAPCEEKSRSGETNTDPSSSTSLPLVAAH